MKVTFYLGPGGTHLGTRKLRITRMMKAGDDSRPTRTYTNQAITNTTETVTVDVPINQIYEAELTDFSAAGDRSDVDVLHFHTGTLQFPGPKSGDRLQILSMEYESSSSSSSSSLSASSLSSRSSISTSSSSTSSQSISSLSSISTSSSSVSTSSISTSSSSSSSSSSSQSVSSVSSVSSISTSASSSSSISTSSSSSSTSNSSSSSS